MKIIKLNSPVAISKRRKERQLQKFYCQRQSFTDKITKEMSVEKTSESEIKEKDEQNKQSSSETHISW